MTPELIGFVAISLAVLFYGSYFVPAKKYEIYDGIVYQWYQCSGILLAGIFSALCNDWSFNVFHEGLLSGGVFVLANSIANTSVKLCGLGNYYTLHQVSNLGLTFVIGTYGHYFGIPATQPHSIGLAAVGITLVFVGAIPVMCMKPEDDGGGDHFSRLESPPSSPQPQEPPPLIPFGTKPQVDQDPRELDHFAVRAPSIRRSWWIGLILGFLAGLLHAGMYVPLLLWQARMRMDGKRASGVDSFFCVSLGMYLGSTTYLMLAGAWNQFRGNRMRTPVLGPAILSGLLYGVACQTYLIAMVLLPYVVAYATGVGGGLLVSQMWGMFFFGESASTHNRLCVACSMFAVLLGVVPLALST